MNNVTSTESLTAMVAGYIEAVRFEHIPRAVLDPIRTSIVDAIGCGILGSTARHVQILTGYFAEMKAAEESVIWGTQIRTTVPFAAAANAAAVHAWDFDDTVLPGMTHPAGIVLSTGLSVAEKLKQRTSGKAFLTAIAAGYEVANVMASALGGIRWRMQGFYNTVPVTFGATAVAGKLLGLDKEKLVAALGIAATQAAGLYSATMTKRFNAPKAVEAGIFAAELARRGFEAPLDGIGDPNGFLATFSRDPQREVIPRDLGKYAFEVFHKFYPCIRSNQPAVLAARQLQDEHGDVRAEAIRKITVRADTMTTKYTVEIPGGGASVSTAGNALVSLPYCVAAMLVDRELTLAQFTAERIHDPSIQGLLKKVELVIDPEIDRLPSTQRYRATVEVELANGAVYQKFCPAPKGDPTNRLTDAEVHEKFMRNADGMLDRRKMEELFELLVNMDELGEVAGIGNFLLRRPL